MQFRMKSLARARGWTLEDLAFRSGVKYTTVKNLTPTAAVEAPAPGSYSTPRGYTQ